MPMFGFLPLSNMRESYSRNANDDQRCQWVKSGISYLTPVFEWRSEALRSGSIDGHDIFTNVYGATESS